MPIEPLAIINDWIISGQIAGSVPLYGQAVNALYLARNSRWDNYLWYDQQKFINWTIQTMEGTKAPLHAASLITLQSRFVLETLLAEDQGVCHIVGEEYCTVIPMHTGEGGNLTTVLEKMWNTPVGTQGGKQYGNGLRIYPSINGIAISLVVLIVMTVSCCVLPLIQVMVKKAMKHDSFLSRQR